MALAPNVESVVDCKGEKFTFSANLIQEEAISMKLVSLDQTERWSGVFGSKLIEDITQKAGAVKRIPIFWKILCSAALNASSSARLDVFFPADLNLRGSDEMVFAVFTVSSEFDKVKYPFRLTQDPFTNDERGESPQGRAVGGDRGQLCGVARVQDFGAELDARDGAAGKGLGNHEVEEETQEAPGSVRRGGGGARKEHGNEPGAGLRTPQHNSEAANAVQRGTDTEPEVKEEKERAKEKSANAEVTIVKDTYVHFTRQT